MMKKFKYPIKDLKKLIDFLGIYQTFLFLAKWLLGSNIITVRIKGVKNVLFVRSRGSDIYALSHIFRREELGLSLTFSPHFIIDGGAYVGYSSVYLANKYPKAQIVAIEPDKKNCEMFLKNTKNYENIILIRGGLWDSHCDLKISNPNTESWAFKLVKSDEHSADVVPGIPIDSILSDFNVKEIDILKLDIEGAEHVLFSSNKLDWIDKVNVFIIELHNEESSKAVTSAFERRKYKKTCIGEKVYFIKS